MATHLLELLLFPRCDVNLGAVLDVGGGNHAANPRASARNHG